MDGKKLIEYMHSKNYRVRAINIVYLEDVDADTWLPVQGMLDVWDDARILVTDDGKVELSCEATTEPGAWYTYNKMNPKGAARIAFGQYRDAWTVGYHLGKQLSLVQVKPIIVHRDSNKDGTRVKDILDIGLFGINQHTTATNPNTTPPVNIGRWSAGCLVGKWSSTHYLRFMPVVSNTGHKYLDTTIIAGDDFHKFKG